MPVGRSKGFSVWTKANQVWQNHLLQFLKEKEFVTADEIYLESIRKNPNSKASRGHGVWGMRPDKHQIYNFVKCKATWIVESDKILITANPSDGKGKKILWELAEDWPRLFGEYSHDMMARADMLREQGTVKYT